MCQTLSRKLYRCLYLSLSQPYNGGPGLLLEVAHTVSIQKQLSWPGFLAPASCTFRSRQSLVLLLWPHMAPNTPNEPSVVAHRAFGPFPSLNRYLCQVSALSLGFPCAFPGLGSCCSFCPEPLFSLFCLVNSLFFKPCFNVILTPVPSPVRINCSRLCAAQQHLSL